MASAIDNFTLKYTAAAQRAAKGTKIFPKVILAAAALESRYGQSLLTKKYNNFFGVKAKKTDTNKILLQTKEDINGKTITINDYFKTYSSPEKSFKDYVRLLHTDRYKKAGVLSAKNEAEQIAAIKKAGYATDTNYVSKLNLLASKITLKNTANAGLGLLALAAGFIFINKNFK